MVFPGMSFKEALLKSFLGQVFAAQLEHFGLAQSVL